MERPLEWAAAIDVDDLLSAERDENAERKDFTPTEAVAIGRLIEEQMRPKVEAFRRENISAARSGVKHPRSRDTREVVAEAVGMGEQKYRYAKAVVDAAEADPEKFGDLPLRLRLAR